jgi:membrane protein YdbS with pleckstrin-like domain
MKTLLKFLGPILILVGVIILSVYFFTKSNSNIYLASAGIVMILGLLSHIVINRKVN